MPSGVFVILVGMAILAVGFYRDGYRLQHRDHATRLEGTVVGISAAHGNRSAGRSVSTAQFIAPDGKISYYSFDISSGEYHLGEKVPLLHDRNTGATVIDSFSGLYGPFLFFAATGAAFVLLGATLLIAAWRRR